VVCTVVRQGAVVRRAGRKITEDRCLTEVWCAYSNTLFPQGTDLP
jgi:hypothetical protein